VLDTFQSNPQNIRNYSVSNIQLYQIYNEPTWVATFYQSNTSGQVFQAIGMVDARHLTGANVIMAPNKTQALADYAQWLADHVISGSAPVPTGTTSTVQGTVVRISSATQSGTTVYSMLISGQTRIFQAGLALSPELPLVQPGDIVRATFLDTGQSVVTLTSFTDTNIMLATPTGTPAG